MEIVRLVGIGNCRKLVIIGFVCQHLENCLTMDTVSLEFTSVVFYVQPTLISLHCMFIGEVMRPLQFVGGHDLWDCLQRCFSTNDRTYMQWPYDTDPGDESSEPSVLRKVLQMFTQTS